MKKFIVLTTLLINFFANSQDSSDSSFIINGQFEENLRGKVILKYGKKELKETVKNGKFMLKGKLSHPNAAEIVFKGKKSKTFYIENSKIDISFKDTIVSTYNGSKKEIWKVEKMTGSQTQLLSEDFKAFYSKYQNDKRFKHLLYNYLNEKIDKHPKNPFYYPVVYQFARRQELMIHAKVISLVDKMDLKYLTNQQRLKFAKILERNSQYSIGKPFPNESLRLQNGDGKEVYSHLGKITLIDFWASWCRPCRNKNPEIKNIYNKYHNKGFNVIGISTDRDKKKWKRAIQEDGLPWVNFNTNSLNKKMYISSIPYTYLLDENGTIIGVNLSQTELEDNIKKKLRTRLKN